MKEQKHSLKMDTPFMGIYYLMESPGTYHCDNCSALLFDAEDKFHCGSGWPAFDACVDNAIRLEETDLIPGKAVYCKSCNSFLGTFISGESFTDKNKRYNINSSALDYVPK